MAIANYSDLTTAIGQWQADTGSVLASHYPTFISSVEAGLNYGISAGPFQMPALRTSDMETFEVLTIDDDGIAELPDDFLEWRGLSTGEGGVVYNVDFASPGRQNWDYPTSYGGTGASFTLSNGQFVFRPIPTDDVTLSYYAKIPALTATNTTNWLLTRNPNVYLFGCLFYASLFAHDDARAMTMFPLFASHVAGLSSSDKGARWARSTARVMGPTP